MLSCCAWESSGNVLVFPSVGSETPLCIYYISLHCYAHLLSVLLPAAVTKVTIVRTILLFALSCLWLSCELCPLERCCLVHCGCDTRHQLDSLPSMYFIVSSKVFFGSQSTKSLMSLSDNPWTIRHRTISSIY